MRFPLKVFRVTANSEYYQTYLEYFWQYFECFRYSPSIMSHKVTSKTLMFSDSEQLWSSNRSKKGWGLRWGYSIKWILNIMVKENNSFLKVFQRDNWFIRYSIILSFVNHTNRSLLVKSAVAQLPIHKTGNSGVSRIWLGLGVEQNSRPSRTHSIYF